MALRRVLCSFLLATLVVGCGAANANGPAPATSDSRTSRKDREKREEPPVLIAPPPAYGNKIVMAECARDTTMF
jgi:hypothetical protein